MTDTNTAEREAATDGKWYMVNKDGMATLCADEADAEREAADAQAIWPGMGPHRAVQLVEAGRASLAANAGREPVAYAIFAENGNIRLWATEPQHVKRIAAEQGLKLVKIYTHHSPPEGMAGWTTLPGQLPEPGTPVLLDIGKKYPIRAMWAPAKTLEASNDSDAVGDYDEATDTYYCPEGWYEWNQHEETHWFVTETPRAWMPLPASEAKEL